MDAQLAALRILIYLSLLLRLWKIMERLGKERKGVSSEWVSWHILNRDSAQLRRDVGNCLSKCSKRFHLKSIWEIPIHFQAFNIYLRVVFKVLPEICVVLAYLDLWATRSFILTSFSLGKMKCTGFRTKLSMNDSGKSVY